MLIQKTKLKGIIMLNSSLAMALVLTSTVSFAVDNTHSLAQRDWNKIASAKIDALIAVQEEGQRVESVNYNCDVSGSQLICGSHYLAYFDDGDDHPWNGYATVTFNLIDGELGAIESVEFGGNL